MSKFVSEKLIIIIIGQIFERYMISANGISRIDVYIDKNGQIHRKAIATFTEEELYNLKNFGDLIAIDPTSTQ